MKRLDDDYMILRSRVGYLAEDVVDGRIVRGEGEKVEDAIAACWRATRRGTPPGERENDG